MLPSGWFPLPGDRSAAVRRPTAKQKVITCGYTLPRTIVNLAGFGWRLKRHEATWTSRSK